ncbi:MAG: CDP-diacylglycerol--glycerol-3-phosphate 3-phosphatidyltransferase [Pseudomonadota bacterium]
MTDETEDKTAAEQNRRQKPDESADSGGQAAAGSGDTVTAATGESANEGALTPAGVAEDRAVIIPPSPHASSGTKRSEDSGLSPELMAILTLPNVLSGLRAVLVLLIVILLLWPWGPQLTGALILFAIAAGTDWLDGRLARAWNQESELGRMIDHIADKLLVCVTLLTLCAIGVIDGVNALAAALILARELAISGLREHLSVKGVALPSSIFAKWKTTFQMVALAALMAAPLAPFTGAARFSGLLILWVAMFMTVVSGFQYAYQTRHIWYEGDNDARS